MKKGCLIAVAVVFALFAGFAVLVGPTLLRNGERIFRPISEMSSAQKEFEAWAADQNFNEPKGLEVSADRLEVFLKLRRVFEGLERAHPMPDESFGRNRKPTLDDIEGLLQGVGANVSQGLEAFRKAGMTPSEYGYLDRAIYRNWLRRLKASGTDPAAIQKMAAEVGQLAASEKDPGAARALRRLAQDLPKRRIAPPDDVPVEVHELLLAHAIEIEELADVVTITSNRRGRVRARD